MTKKEKVIELATKKISLTLAIVFAVGLVCVISSLFIWIWSGFGLALKIFATGIVIIFISGYVNVSITRRVGELYDKIINEQKNEY